MIQYDILANFWLRIALSASNIYILFAVFCLWYFVQFRWFACYCLPSQTHCEKTSFIPLRYVDHSKSAKLRSKWICDSPPQIHICAACSVAQSCLTLCDRWTVARQAPLSMRFSRQKYWSGLPLLQGIFPTQESNPGLPHWRQVL